ncbi:MAG: pyrimidine dimer DNA glycosylase/endonuclease V [Bacteroidales bacterium]
MTRINVVPVSELSQLHLVAEYREITRLPKNLSTSLARKGKKFELKEIPEQYTLGTGHVKFFYSKMLFLEKRFDSLVAEMLRRGYNPTYRDSSIFANCDKQFYNDYVPTPEAIEINKARILERTK